MSITEKIDYLFGKINWGASALDAQAIEIMNTLKAEVLDIQAQAEKNAQAYQELRGQYEDVFDRLTNGRSYLMETENVTVADALESLGCDRNGFRIS